MPGTGIVTIHAGAGLGGMFWTTLDLEDPTAKPYYVDEDGYPSLGLQATTPYGEGGFVEVQPGDVEIRLSAMGKHCKARFAWPGDEPNTIVVPVREGFVSWSSVACQLP